MVDRGYSAPPHSKDSALPQIVRLDEIPADAVEALLDRAFGADRHTRTAYRLREGVAAIAPASLAMLDKRKPDKAALIGTIQLWPIMFAGDDGARVPMTLVGPVAVEPVRQNDGIGRTLMRAAIDAATAIGAGDAMMLIGDPAYYGRFFGFSADRTGAWRLPGPVERHRLLARGDRVPATAGALAPRIGVTA